MKLKKRYVFTVLGLIYLVFSHSCMTMRKSTKDTKAYFVTKNIAYQDSSVQIGEHSIHYIKTGKDEKPTLVLIHGSPGGWSAWETYMSDTNLLKNYRIIAPDRPGFGYSEFRKSMNLEDQSKLLNKFLDSLSNDRPITLVGHSYGGPLIVKMALERPNRYANLVILAGALDPNAEKPEKWRKPLTWFPLKYLVPGALKPSNDELWMLKQDLFKLQPQLKNLSENIIIVHGTEDKLVPYSNVGYMKKEFTSASGLEVITFEGERHFIVWDREEEVKGILMKISK